MTKASTTLAKFMTELIEEHGTEEFVLLWSGELKEKFIKLAEKTIPKADKKAVKDKDAPKGAKNSFIIYCSDKRSEVKTEFPDLKPTEITKIIAERWKEDKLDSDVLAHYKSLADEDKIRASEAKKAYVPKAVDKEEKKKTTRSKSGWDLFRVDETPSVKSEGFTGKDIMAELAVRWKNLQADDRETYQEYLDLAKSLKA
jgi:hypothetical protein